jgi:hypothetical protein
MAHVFRDDSGAQMESADDEFWLAIPLEHRAQVVWELSEELFTLAEPESRERRFPRSSFRVEPR